MLHRPSLPAVGLDPDRERAVADPTSRYPTAFAATLSMASFPFTMQLTGGRQGRGIGHASRYSSLPRETTDRVALHLGLQRNGDREGVV